MTIQGVQSFYSIHEDKPMKTPALRGGLLALLAATLFGVSTPLVQYFGVGLGALTTPALLYAGAAVAGGLLMLGGVLLHLVESHGHGHEHAALDHEHAHDHADGHHQHTHSHLHHHEAQAHTHPHVPDAHHQHRHG
ncbi:MAG: hypothetical protein Q8O29_02785 [Polaromonas sp.]|uniref:hypothetical protein n=1 Tax=Polaromonas sp. TaxID=1869339 RepID=UPI002732C56E|nr:hypothetical protein [Polaromonas sp.]MDP2817201.1 hypothetical protein [Polaromonas sp.]